MSFLGSIMNILFPPSCPVCGGAVRGSELCAACEGKFRREMFYRCPKCSLTADKCRCNSDELISSVHPGAVIGGKTSLSLTFYLNTYKRDEDRVTEKMIFALKEKGVLADYFAGICSDALKRLLEGENLSEWILTYPPRSTEKLTEFGYDQCREIVKGMASRLGMEWAETLRREGGEEQKKLGSEMRAKNADKTLLLIRENVVRGGKYIVLDDILTTGATLASAMRNLYFGGAAQVFPMTIAKNLYVK